MSRRQADAPPLRLLDGSDSEILFNHGAFWVGQHSGDRDILVFDPDVSDPAGEVISFYSLEQHRSRSFSREVVRERIPELQDELSVARARRAYGERQALQAGHEETLVEQRVEIMNRQRLAVLEAHRRYLAEVGVEYAGVEDTEEGRKLGRRTRCHACRIDLDDFARAACATCAAVLCSCGACGCGAPRRAR